MAGYNEKQIKTNSVNENDLAACGLISALCWLGKILDNNVKWTNRNALSSYVFATAKYNTFLFTNNYDKAFDKLNGIVHFQPF